MTHLEAELNRIEASNPDKARIIEQYRAVAGKFVELWAAIDERTKLSDWRADGIGSCHTSPHLFQTYLDGVVALEIEGLWEAKAEDDLVTLGNTCVYHREGVGCILGDLKSPRCIEHSDPWHRAEIQDRLKIKLPDFRGPLRTIQAGGLDWDSNNCTLHPEDNDALVQKVVEETQLLIDAVKVNPVLHPRQ